MIVHAAVHGLLLCLSLRGLYHFARMFGTLEWLINYRLRRRFAVALRRVRGHEPSPQDCRRTTRAFFMQARCDKLFYLVFDQIPPEQAAGLLTITNQELLDEAVARGRGVYLAMSHFGAQHVAAMLLALRGYRVAGVRDRREGPLRRFVQQRFERRYPQFPKLHVIFSERFPREIYRCLQSGYLLGSLMDISRVRDSKQRTNEIEIFGEKRRFVTGPLRIAVRCGAPVLQAFVIPEEAFRYRFEIVEKLIDPDEATDDTATIEQAMRTYASNVERYTRKWPSLMTRL